MNATRFIAGRLRFRGKIAMAAIAVSFLVMIIAVSVSSGFREAVRDGVSAVSGDIQVTPSDQNYAAESEPIPSTLSCDAAIRALPGVEDIVPAVYRAGIVKSGDLIHGVLVKGTPQPGRDSSLRVRIPARLAEITGLGEGDDLLTYFIGETVKVRKFRIESVYDSPLELGETLLVEADIADLQRLSGWSEDQASALEIILSPRVRGRSEELAQTVGNLLLRSESEEEQYLVAASAQRRYPQLFDWLDLLDFNVLFVLILMTVVAGFNMISGLLILLFRNIPTIGTLKTLGMTDRAIGKVFLRVAAVLVFKGMLIGNALALLFCLIQGTTHLVRLNPSNYFVSWVPVSVNLPAILLADAAAFAAILLLLLIPTLFIARVDPADTVRMK